MPSQTITVTALPNGFAPDGRCRLSIHLAPRLSGGSLLSDFPDFLVFPRIARTMSFAVAFDTRDAVPAAIEPFTPPPSDDVWTAIFPSSSAVEPFTFDAFDGRRIRSYPVSNVKQFLQNTYTAIGAADPTEFPDLQTLLEPGLLGQLASDAEDGSDVTGSLEAAVDASYVRGRTTYTYLPPQEYDPANIGTDLTQVKILYRPRTTLPDALPALPTIDFHKALALLGNHPAILRRLGLIRDLLVPAPPDLADLQTVTVTIGWTPAPIMTTQMVQTRTRFLPTPFVAAPRSPYPELAGRRLRLSDPPYDVVDFDVDGAALKAMQLASTLARAASDARSTPSTDKQFSLPALRSEGLVLVKAGKAADVQASLDRQKGLDAAIRSTTPSVPELFGEDLVRGYYVDVYDHNVQRWFPLCARHVQYRHLNSGPLGTSPFPIEIEDEGPITLAATSGSGDPVSDIMLPEVVAKWSGWSAVVPRPGNQLTTDGGLQPDGTEKPVIDAPANTDDSTNLKLGMTLSVPKDRTRPKLPSLRYGRQYQLRARSADLAGNADAFDATIRPDAEFYASAVTQFSRYDPVPPPAILPAHDFKPGESAHRMVIRSNYADPAGQAQPTSRHLAPPRASQLLVELAGELDDPATGRLSGSETVYAMLASRDGIQPDGTLPTFDSSPLNQKYSDPAGANGANSTDPGSFIFPGEWLVVPYLPDPFSRGMVVSQLPFAGTAAAGVTPTDYFYGAQWIRSSRTQFETVGSNRLKLREATSTTYAPKITQVSGNHQELSLYLPKGSVTTVRVSSTLAPDTKDSAGKVLPSVDVVRLGIWLWLQEGANGTPLTDAQKAALRTLMAQGLHWMTTPYTEVTLVHAVRQPLLAPRWPLKTGLDANRGLGETAVKLDCGFTISGRSTARTVLHADWTEQVDNPATGAAPGVHSFTAVPHSFGNDSLSYPIAASGKPLGVVANSVSGTAFHELHDHRHRVINYTLESISSFAEEFTESGDFSVRSDGTLTLATTPLIGGYTKIVDPGTGRAFEAGVDYLENRPTAGTIQVPTGSPVPLGTPLAVTYLAGPISRRSDEIPNNNTDRAVITVDIPATVRPKAPEVLYAVPAHSWSGWSSNSSGARNLRTGNTIRVWLARPWFSSGDGEKLAVLLPPPPATSQPDAQDVPGLHGKVSLIGADPIWGDLKWTYPKTLPNGPQIPSGPTRKMLTPANFPLATTKITADNTGLGLVLESGENVSAAVHEVSYDATKDAWYCDIQIDPGPNAYTPFVQLALARSQASALKDISASPPYDLGVSAVVLLEIAQLSPSRTATLTFSTPTAATGTNPSGLAASISGLSYESTGTNGDDPIAGPSLKGPSMMTVQVQVVRDGMDPTTFPDTAWVDQGPLQTMARSITTAGMATWKLSTIKLPYARGLRPMRLVFTEYEEMYDVTGLPSRGRIVFVTTYVLAARGL